MRIFKSVVGSAIWVLLFSTWIFPTTLAAPALPPAPLYGSWYGKPGTGTLLDLDPAKTRWITLNHQLQAVTLNNQGQLVIWSQDVNGIWQEGEKLASADAAFTVFQTADLNHDGIPELIAGTAEPGFIYIYRYSTDHWVLHNYEKYVWKSITNLTSGNFDGNGSNDILVQNQEGSLFLLNSSENSLDLIWKSPIFWRPISSFLVRDIDNDAKDELIVTYRTGGIGILKLINNQIVSIWENYLWGKILDISYGDWDNDLQTEILISTTQKVIYFLGYNGKTYQFENQLSSLNYTVERMEFRIADANSQILAADTAGKLHLLEFHSQTKKWIELMVCQVGRVAQLIPEFGAETPYDVAVWLWGTNRLLSKVQFFKTSLFRFWDGQTAYELNPALIYQDDRFYIAPRAIAALPGLGLKYTQTKTGFQIKAGEDLLELNKKDTTTIKLNGTATPNSGQAQIIGNDLYLEVTGYQNLLNLSFIVDPELRQVSADIPAPPEA